MSSEIALGRTPAWEFVRALGRHRTSLWVVICAIALIGWLGPRVLLGPQVPVGAVLQRDFVQSVVASGRVEAPHRVSIGAQIVGAVKQSPSPKGKRSVPDSC